ncbi:hypothetical protein BCR34DRAFT_553721 [Clohesyomyces aquaticus]|uniref:DUF7730 domain-containing protein n=1 Tax=Clohesyomyces aquaticus TaxID=1231657 RepID=A0A1Y2A7N9_9PLEO|nr:hypothetical protein BCR34DRAFT_553721 [Clohesyomyces aquaticus]
MGNKNGNKNKEKKRSERDVKENGGEESAKRFLGLPPEIRCLVYEAYFQARWKEIEVDLQKGGKLVASGRFDETYDRRIRKEGGDWLASRLAIIDASNKWEAEKSVDAVPLLRTCRTVYREATPLLYSLPTFYFQRPESLLAFCGTIPPPRFHAIQHIVLRLGKRGSGDQFGSFGRPTEEFTFAFLHRSQISRYYNREALQLPDVQHCQKISKSRPKTERFSLGKGTLVNKTGEKKNREKKKRNYTTTVLPMICAVLSRMQGLRELEIVDDHCPPGVLHASNREEWYEQYVLRAAGQISGAGMRRFVVRLEYPTMDGLIGGNEKMVSQWKRGGDDNGEEGWRVVLDNVTVNGNESWRRKGPVPVCDRPTLSSRR